ncbi:NAD(P)/FAD-dependent oxidoreductase [Ramlibacter rhizophilus]|uniref:FAD-dependent oxidoreductase n=1 Tax=Ramlibacter rhizophilus TaxID=1781167 RepID=A0A4Z0BVE1_9BURK|nr:FAD-dependent oxidoreductase [Ramlibacter rhizophilus]TFZ03287.1 FAD-dependent oxidoreductase [Ramlibacter rhizophilus]
MQRLASRSSSRTRPTSDSPSTPHARARRVAVIGAGIAGLACARTLAQAGHEVWVFDKGRQVGGRMACRDTPFGGFDHGVQYFTVRDERFARVLKLNPGLCKPWRANAVRVLDPLGRVAEVARHRPEAHWVPVPGMNALPRAWAEPLAAQGRIAQGVRVVGIEAADAGDARWRLKLEGGEMPAEASAGFDQVLLALPSAQASELLRASGLAADFVERIEAVRVAPCWTLMVAFPHAQSAGQLGPQWNAATSTHHRIAWLSRESSKPGRDPVERWTVQASASWSTEHLEDDAQRVAAKLLKGFAEVTGIRAEPTHAQVHRWRYAKTHVPLGQSFLLDAEHGLGVCGDWCLGHRVEDAFVSGLELALAAL